MSLVKSIGNKKVNFDFNKNFITIFSDKINNSDIQFINQTLKDLHPSDVANLIENLSYDTRVKLIEIESFNIAPEIFIELNESIQGEVLKLLSINSIANIIKRLESDDAVSILENIEIDKKNLILDKLPPKDRFLLEEGLSYPEDSAARIMQREFTAIPSDWTVGQTIDYLRESNDLPQEFLEIFIVDNDFKPIGIVPSSRVLRTPREFKMNSIMREMPVLISVNMDKEEVGHTFENYNLVSAGVVNKNNKLVGMITADDVVTVVQEEA
ncbi:MAG: magnesium transporter, partial [Pelagibacteraceae bacterium]